MPDYFSHCIAAYKIYEKLGREQKAKIGDRTLYLLGAQGGDVFFTYNLNPNKTNLGRHLHNLPADELFDKLLGANPSYVAGFATHYAMDCTLHPAIYAFEESKKAPFAHLYFENDLGLYISRKYAVQRKILPRDEVVGATFAVYDAIRRVEDGVTVTGIERCLKRHFSFTRLIYRKKKQTYRYEFDYTTLSGAVEDGVELGVAAVESVLSGKADRNIFNKSFLEK